ncbi:exocyst complex component EXO70B1-like [Ipomoea triloba]|uniref:exocyst complex component EXO70B1-like n=1 Tax=Ipomoea triloba TaxID=35885 RepID=UPI00125E9B89|nr:exocyst complex component EXO70B1-like [Ipomoea triloba]
MKTQNEDDKKDHHADHQQASSRLPPDLLKVSQDIDHYIFNLWSSRSGADSKPPDVPICVEQFAVLLEEIIDDYTRTRGHPLKWSQLRDDEAATFLESTNRISKLSKSLCHFSSEYKYAYSISRIGGVLQRAMSYLEDEFKSYLDDCKALKINPDTGPAKQHSIVKRDDDGGHVPEDQEAAPDHSNHHSNHNKELLETNKAAGAGGSGCYSEEIMSNLNKLAKALMFGGYEAECWHAYFVARRNVMEDSLSRMGFERRSIDEVQKTSWECVEREIVAWLRTFKYCTTELFTSERKLTATVFSDHPSMSESIISDLCRFTVIQLLHFSNAVAVTKRSPDKLYKFLDVYEALRDLLPSMDTLLRPQCMEELKAETLITRCRLGEMMINIIQELEITINADPPKNPVPGGGVHPLTRYAVTTIENACCYKETLDQVFLEHLQFQQQSGGGGEVEVDPTGSGAGESHHLSPFGMQIARAMELLDANLEAKSKLYKDPSLSMIFMMNNGRHILQKVKESPGASSLLGSAWIKKRSSDLRQYHKNYQRETWGRLMQCLSVEGLISSSTGKVHKPVLKEKFKSFNAVFDDIHKTQASWVISDEQLQSELRVSITNMVVPAYRSFIARFSQTFTPGRQTEKYIKYQGEDLEKYIDELFDGSAAGKKK